MRVRGGHYCAHETGRRKPQKLQCWQAVRVALPARWRAAQDTCTQPARSERASEGARDLQHRRLQVAVAGAREVRACARRSQSADALPDLPLHRHTGWWRALELRSGSAGGREHGEIGAGKYSSALCSVRCTFRPRPAVSAAASRPGDGGCPTHRPRSGATARRQLPAARRGGAPRARAGSPAKHTRNSAYAWPPARPEEQRARGTTDGGGERTTRTPARLRPGKAATTHTHKASAAARSAMP